MDAVVESGRNPASKHHRFSLTVESVCGDSNEQADAGGPGDRTCLVRPNYEARKRDREKLNFPVCSVDCESDWQPPHTLPG